MEDFNLSAIERDSFLEGLQKTFDHPLHSTAIEGDLNDPTGQRDKGKAGGQDIPTTSKTFVKQTGAAVKRKNTERGAENGKQEEKKRRGKSSGGNVVARTEKEAERKKEKGAPRGQREDSDTGQTESDTSGILQKGDPLTPTASSVRRLVGKKPAKRSAAPTPAARGGHMKRKVKKQQMKKDKKRESKPGSGPSNDPEPENPSPKKTKGYSVGGTGKSSSKGVRSEESSSGSEHEESDEADANKKSKKRRRQRGTELEVVLDTFTDFCDEYRESVESTAAKRSIDTFSTHVKQQLIEKITSYKEFEAVKRENVKVASLIQKKRQTLLDAKYELMRAERQRSALRKEKSELELRLADLRKGQTFMHDLRELNKLYLIFRYEHPKEEETYGESSLPALQLETKMIQAADHKHEGTGKRLK